MSLDVPAATIHGVLGRSGAGKSTLLRVVNLLEPPDSGTVTVAGRDLGTLTPAGLRDARARIGMVFQHFHLLHNRTVAANVELPLKLHRVERGERQRRVAELLELVGLSDQARKFPAQLSGGQRQRVAIARALALRPDVLLSDEATSALDPGTTVEILDLFVKLRDTLGLTILLITHELDVITRICDSASVMRDGKVVEHGPVAELLATPGSDLADQAFRLAAPGEGGGINVEVTFTGSAVGEPVLAALVRHFDVDASITDASVHTVAQGTVGRLRLRLPQSAASEKAAAWLSEQGYGVRRI
ncbi:methionine ABC transporter ATP-binding protein [Stackebrandtia nassauensis]|uniref:methionine ABC transporter ATP-binding protein n=1 Tax=Stackebrandtia nassauensis TaxID=283811 RepID=UPI001B7FBA75|nr:methionine ABC transporter ATP-binding protein [Stackebrandtia nassauensis]